MATLEQLSLFSRTGDPETSKEAGADAARKDLRASLEAVHRVLSILGPASAEHLVERYKVYAEAHAVVRQSESGIRSRLAELRRRGRVALVMKMKNARGKKVHIWRAV